MPLDIAPRKTHTHKETVAHGIGKCACGRVVKYIDDGKNSRMEIINPGDPNYVDPPAPISPFSHDKPERIFAPGTDVLPTITPAAPILEKKSGAGGGYKNRERHKYYEDNREKIVADIKEMGLKKALLHWEIPPSTWSGTNGLAVKWGMNDTVKHYSKRVKSTPVKPGKEINKTVNNLFQYIEVGSMELLKEIVYFCDQQSTNPDYSPEDKLVYNLITKYLVKYQKLVELIKSIKGGESIGKQDNAGRDQNASA